MSINKNAELLPYYERAKDILKYNPTTGLITRFIKCRNRDELAGTLNKGYIKIGVSLIDSRRYLLAHRLAWYIYYGELPNVIDHINGIKTDNSISNLRSCTQQQNTFNRTSNSNNTSGYKGVAWHKGAKKWISQIRINGHLLYLGSYDSAEEANKAYEEKAKEAYGIYFKDKIN